MSPKKFCCGTSFSPRRTRFFGAKLGARVGLTKAERIRLAKLGNKLGRKALHGVSAIVKPETILAWYRKLVAKKFDSSQRPRKPGRPPIDSKIEMLVLKMVSENPAWGYDRIRGALMNIGHKVSGVSALGGVGFTVALYIAGLAFKEAPELLTQAKVGILLGSLGAGILGCGVLRMTAIVFPEARRASQSRDPHEVTDYRGD